MKPLKVEMSAFGSYAGQETIDFEKIGHGIFLITGDTGAGKTTIFDAITYALFGETSGQNRDGTMMRSQYAKDEEETYASLYFEERGQVYQIYRSPAYTRKSKKKNKDGEYNVIKNPAKARLILPDGREYPGNIRDINIKVQEILGVDREQFSQISMIAQGAYLKLLHAPSKERKEIFSRIFNTEIYKSVQWKLKDKNRILYGKLEDNKKLCANELENIDLLQESLQKERWEFLLEHQETKEEELEAALKDIIKEAREEEEKIKILGENQRKLLSNMEGRISHAKDINKLFDVLEQAEGELAFLKGQEEEKKETEKKRSLAKKAAIAEAFEWDLIQKQADVKDSNEKIEKLKKVLDTLKKELAFSREEMELFEKQAEEALPKLAAKIARREDAMPLYQSWSEKRKALRDQEKQREESEKESERIEKALKVQKKQWNELEVIIEELDKNSRNLPGLETQVISLSEREQALKSIKSQWKDLLEREQDEIEKHGITKAAQENYEKAEAIYNAMYREFLAAQAGIMAKELNDGMPCPVCGSVHHPMKAPLSKEAVTQAKTEKAKEERNKAEDQRTRAAQESIRIAELVRHQRNQLHAELRKWMGVSAAEEICEEEISSALMECKESLKTAQKAQKEAQAAGSLLKKKYMELEELEKQRKLLELEREEALEKCQKQRLLEAQLKAQAEQLRSRLPLPDENQAKKELESLKKEEKHLKDQEKKARERLAQAAEEVKENNGRLSMEQENNKRLHAAKGKADELFLEALKEQGFACQEDYNQAKQPLEVIEQWEREGREYDQKLLKASTIYNQYKEQTMGKERIDTQQWQQQLMELKKEQGTLLEKESKVTGICMGNEKAEKKLKAMWKIAKQLKEEYKVIHMLYQTANGKLPGTAGLDFQTYVQRQYFKKMIQSANRRLKIMTQGQLLLMCRELDSLGKQGEVGLDLDVYSVATDKIRDVKTLSGGESFMAALSMALGMADIIQSTAGSVRVDALFIDEGFGSLDEETRMGAVRILRELAGERCLIGIISHVTELKEQIGRKLIVHKNERGSRISWVLEE